MALNTQSTINTLANMTDKELANELDIHKKNGDRDKGMKVLEELKRRENPANTNASKNAFDGKFDTLMTRMQDKNLKNHPKNYELKAFFEQDVKNYRSEVDNNLKQAIDFKDKKIEELKAQLDEQLTTPPKLSEYISPKRYRLSKIYGNMKKLKIDPYKKDYPRNFLLYAASETDKVFFGVRKFIKRNRIKKIKNSDPKVIVKELTVLERKLDTSNDEKTPRKKNLKIGIRTGIKEAKIAAVKEQANVFGVSTTDLDMPMAA